MKALPIWQPWASLVACGAKRVETRDYPPGRIGLSAGQRIAIHATKTTRNPDTGEKLLDFCEREPFCQFVSRDAIPLGALVATATLDRASEMTEASIEALLERNPQEWAFGFYSPGRWAWVLRDVVALPEPVPFQGSQGTFDVPDEMVGIIPDQGVLL